MADKKETRPPLFGGKKFHFIDALIILIILAVLAAALYAYLPGFLSSGVGSRKQVTYTVTFLKPVENSVRNSIAPEQAVICEKTEFGKVQQVTSVDSSAERPSVVLIEEGKDTVTVTVAAEANITDSGVRVNGKKLSIGEIYALILPSYAGEAVCTDIKIGD